MSCQFFLSFKLLNWYCSGHYYVKIIINKQELIGLSMGCMANKPSNHLQVTKYKLFMKKKQWEFFNSLIHVSIHHIDYNSEWKVFNVMEHLKLLDRQYFSHAHIFLSFMSFITFYVCTTLSTDNKFYSS